MPVPRPFDAHPTIRLPLIAISLVVMSACARTGAEPPSPEPPAPASIQLAGDYTGSLTVEGNLLRASLSVLQEGANLTLQLSVSDLGAVARGTGVAHDDRFSASVPYEINCPGEASFEGRVEEDGRVLSGSLTARDCDGTMNGTFRFSRQGL
jgi:hypothetical protein